MSPRSSRLAWLAAPLAALLAVAGVLLGTPEQAQAAPVTWNDPVTGVRYLHDPDNPAAGATVWGAFAEDEMPGGGGSCLRYEVGFGPSATVSFLESITVNSVVYPVVGIEPHAFDRIQSDPGGPCDGLRVTFGNATIVIPASITWIGEGAFNQAQIGNVIFDPDGQLETIGEQAFFGTTHKDFTIPASVTSIGAHAFFAGLSQTFTFLGDPPSVGPGTNFSQTFTRFLDSPPTYPTLYFNCDAAGITFPTWNGYHTVPAPGQVCYDPNGGSGGLMRQAGTGTITLNAPSPTRTHYTLSGWNTASGGGGTAYANGATVTLGTEEGLYLYAQWTGETITHSFDGNGATGGATASVSGEYGTDTTLPANGFTRSHYNFTGWGLSPSATTLAAPGSTQSLTENTTWYARWAAQAYALTIDLAGGTAGSPANPVSYTIESSTFILTPPTRTGYSFAGWTGTGLGGPALLVEIPTGSTGDRSYTATWSLVDYPIDYDLAGGTEGSPANPVSYTIESGELVLSIPTRAGHTFLGWDGTDLAGITREVHIPTGSTGYRHYTAVWAEVVITLDRATGTAGSDLSVQVEGLLPGDSYSIVLHSTPVVLATLVAAGDGTLDALVTIPSGTPVGPHTIEIAPAHDELASLAFADFTVLGLARTGVDAAPAVIAASMLLGFGLVILVSRRRPA